MRRKNDILLKSAFEEAFPDLLRFFFKDADALFDMTRGFEFLDKELNELFPELQKKGGSRFVDMLVKAFAMDGQEEYLLIHIEIQAQNDPQFSKRMFQYFYRIYDRYDVPITALAIFTGSQPAGSSAFNYHYLGTSLHYDFRVYHIMEHTETQLLAMDNPFSLIVLAAQKALLTNKIPEHELAEHRLTIAKTLIKSKKYGNEQIRRFLYFLKTFIHIDNAEINVNFDKQISFLTEDQTAMGIIETIKLITREEALEEGMEKGIEVGIEKGIEVGIEKGKVPFVKNLLNNTDFDIVKIASLADVSEDFVLKIRDKM